MSAKRPVPALRGDLELEVFPEAESGSAMLVAQVLDRRLRRRIKLDRTGLLLYRLIDGRRDLDDIDDALRRQGALLPPHLLVKTIEFFEKNLLLESSSLQEAASKTREQLPAAGTYRLRSEPSAAPVEVHFLEETRHTCVGCGQCCRGYQFGPLTDEEAARLATETFEEEGERIQGSRKVVQREIEGKMVPLLETREDGRCVFLSEDKRCIVHREKGADAKPWMCQAFPLRFVATQDGRLFGFLQMECFGYHEARKSARPYVERADEVRHVIRVAGPFPVLGPATLLGNRSLELAEYETLESWILEALKAHSSTPGTGLVLAGQLLGHLERGGELEAFSPRPAPLPESDAAWTRAVAVLARETAGEPATTVGGELIGASPEMRRWFADALDFFRGEGDPHELVAIARVADACEDGECTAILTEFLRNEVFSKEWYRAGDLRLGFSLTLARYVLTLSGARMQAHREGTDRVAPRALTHALCSVQRSLRTLRVESFAERHHAELLEIYESFTRSCAQG